MARVTLVIGVLTDQYVALVSDRRVTWANDDIVTRQEDSDTKTFSMRGQFLMGFTGLARIDGLRIEAWVSRVLMKVKAEDYFVVLTQQIDMAFRRMGIDGKQAHAFLAVGYAIAGPDDNHVYPYRIVMSNSIDSSGKLTRSALGSGFRMHVRPLGNSRQLIAHVGWPMRKATLERLRQQIRAVTRGDPANPALSIGPLVSAVRETAEHSQESVGKTVLFTSMPKCALPDDTMTAGLFGHLDFRRKPVALYLSEDVRNPEDAEFYAPAIISKGPHFMGISVYSKTPTQSLADWEGWTPA